MTSFEILDNPLTEKYNHFAKYFNLTDWGKCENVPFVLRVATPNDNETDLWAPYYFHAHTIAARSNHPDEEGRKDSQLYNMCRGVVAELLEHNGQSLNKLYRACINRSFPQHWSKQSHTARPIPHVDHPFPHKVMIIYLECSPGSGRTILCEERVDFDAQVLPTTFTDDMLIVPQKDKVVTFDGSLCHYMSIDLEPRTTLVATYV